MLAYVCYGLQAALQQQLLRQTQTLLSSCCQEALHLGCLLARILMRCQVTTTRSFQAAATQPRYCCQLVGAPRVTVKHCCNLAAWQRTWVLAGSPFVAQDRAQHRVRTASTF